MEWLAKYCESASLACCSRAIACSSSDFACRYWPFSATRKALLSLISVSTLPSSVSAAAFSFPLAATASSCFWMVALFFVICHSSSSTLSAMAWVWFLQSSTFLMSSASSVCRVASKVSMAWMTWSKCPTSPRRPPAPMAAASAASRRLLLRLACSRSSPRARARGASSWPEASCRKAGRPGCTALARSSRASSLVRMASACAMPLSSSVRKASRADHSSVLATHEAFVASKKAMSACICASESA
mmetsp:Transcript_75857/g.222366  ORF Transcript_75857/g.222366 Transcript_75857/m.222366 type:complete len:245 (+) Transcript_75857:656-1390(+)